MSTIEVLVSTMEQTNLEFFKAINIQTDAVIINQNKVKNSIEYHTINGCQVKLVNCIDRGLSKSRNLAIEHATADICVLADDDMVFKPGAFKMIKHIYEEHPEADLIAFKMDIKGNPERVKKYRKKKSWQNYYTSIAIMSGEISFRRKKIADSSVRFNPNQGTGTEFYHGEENVFLYDALRAGLKILYVPVTTVEVDFGESSWYEGYTDKYFHVTGAKCYNMSSTFYPFLYIYYALEHYRAYKKNYSFIEAMKLMHEGAKMYQNRYGPIKLKKPTKN